MGMSSIASLAAFAELANTLDLGKSTAKVGLRQAVSLTDGTGAGQANRVFQDTRTLAASASEDLDLAGVLTGPDGAVITFARIKLLAVVAAPGNANNVVVGGAASNAWLGPFGAAAHTIAVRPGEPKLICAAADAVAYPVTAGTVDLLKIANSGAGTSVTYSILIVGSSA